MKTNLLPLALLAAMASSDDLEIQVDGSSQYLAEDSFVDYGCCAYGSQNDHAADAVPISIEGSTISLNGNVWIAVPFEYSVVPQTVLELDFTLQEEAEIHGICLDDSLDYSEGDPVPSRCIRFAGTQSTDWHAAEEYTAEGTTKHYQFRLLFDLGILGAVNYLGFVTDSDSSLSKGKSSYSNILIYEDPTYTFPFQMEINGVQTGIGPAVSFGCCAYGFQDDNSQTIEVQVISEDQTTLTISGNYWKAFPLPFAYPITPSTVLEFDVLVQEETEIHAICLEDDLTYAGGAGPVSLRCLQLSGTQGTDYLTLNEAILLETQHYRVQVGLLMSGDIRVVAFVQDSDDDVDKGQTIYSNIRLYDDSFDGTNGGPPPNGDQEDDTNDGVPTDGDNGVGAAPTGGFTIEIYGEETSVGVPPEAYGCCLYGEQDGNNLFELIHQNNESSVVFNGNSWKAFRLPNTLSVTNKTVLEFDFVLYDEPEIVSICLDDDLVYDTEGRVDNNLPNRCWQLAGTQQSKLHIAEPIAEIVDLEAFEVIQHYRMEIGRYYFVGSVQYLAFIMDNDEDATFGRAKFGNIRVFEDDSLVPFTITVDDSPHFLGLSLPYGCCANGYQDELGHDPLRFSDEGHSITLNGNTWRAFPFLYIATAESVLSFDVTLEEKAEIHGICLDDSLDYDADDDNGVPFRCWRLEGTQHGVAHLTIDGPSVCIGCTRHIEISVGSYFTGLVRYISFHTDSDADLQLGKVTFSNIRIDSTRNDVVDNTNPSTVLASRQDDNMQKSSHFVQWQVETPLDHCTYPSDCVNLTCSSGVILFNDTTTEASCVRLSNDTLQCSGNRRGDIASVTVDCWSIDMTHLTVSTFRDVVGCGGRLGQAPGVTLFAIQYGGTVRTSIGLRRLCENDDYGEASFDLGDCTSRNDGSCQTTESSCAATIVYVPTVLGTIASGSSNCLANVDGLVVEDVDMRPECTFQPTGSKRAQSTEGKSGAVAHNKKERASPESEGPIHGSSSGAEKVLLTVFSMHVFVVLLLQHH